MATYLDRIVIKKVPQSSNRALALRSGSAQLTQRLTTREFNGLRNAPGAMATAATEAPARTCTAGCATPRT